MSKFENSDMGVPTFNVPSQEANFCDRGRVYPLHIPLARSAWFRILRMSHAPERAEKMMSFHVQNVGSYRYMERVKRDLKEKNQKPRPKPRR